ncbi:MAG: class I SAM-dependent methyltransferase [Planctomycetota bacterium]|jgi:SAM-dependent methyltransferase
MPDASEINFGRQSDDYARHRPGPPGSFYDRLEQHVSLAGAVVLDLGTGPGLVALALARRGARVTGVDIAPEQIDVARRSAAEQGLGAQTEFLVAPAERTGLAAESFDLVIASQCWFWFDHDTALSEVARVLRPGGVLVVAHYCYLANRSRIAGRTEALVLEFNPGWTMAGWDGVYPDHIDTLQQQGLVLVEQFCYDHLQPFTHESWRGRMRTCNGVGSGVSTDEQVAAFDAALAEMLRREFPDEPLQVEHRVWAVILRKPQEPQE